MLQDEKTKLNVEMESVDNKTIEQEDERPLSFGEWLRVDLDEEQLQIIVDNILKKIDEIDEERKPYEEKIKEYRKQYDQIMNETSLPFPGAFNLCAGMTTKNVDTAVSQTEEAFEDVDPKWTIETPPDKSLIPARDVQEKILDYYSDSEMEDVDAWTKIYHDVFLLGNGWLSMVFKREFVRVRDFVEYSNLDDFIRDYPDDYQRYTGYVKKLAEGKSQKLIIECNQEVCRSSKPEAVEWEDVYVPLNTEGLEGMMNANIIARRVMMVYSDIFTLEEEGDYRKGVSNKIKYKVGLQDESSGNEIDPEYLTKSYETFEVIYSVDVDGDGRLERCLFNIEKESKTCLRAIRYPYNHNRPYLIPYYAPKTKSGIYQDGLGSKLQNVEIAGSALINHILNSSIIANSLSLKVRSGSDALRSLYEKRWYPGSILELMNLDDVQQLIFNTPNLSSLINLFAIIERFGQDISGLVNYMSGQESGEDPEAPASKTFALMRKSELKLRRYIKNIKKSNNEAGYQALKLIYQYVPHTRIAEILGIPIDDVKLLKYPLKVITQASGFAIEKIFEKRDNMQWLGILMKEPLIINSDKRRIKLYEIMAKDYGSSWDKKLAQIISSEEVEKMKQEEDLQKRKAEIIQRGVKQGLDNGADEESAKQIGLSAGEKFEQIMAGGM